MLSHASRKILIQAVCASIPLYWMPQEKINIQSHTQFQSLSSSFYWAGKDMDRHYLTLIAWDKVTIPRLYGGLGILDLKVQSKAFHAHMVWHFLNHPEALWV